MLDSRDESPIRFAQQNLGALNHTTPTGPVSVQGVATNIAPNVAGRVIAVEVSPNQKVKSGDVLFRIDRTIYGADVFRLEASPETANSIADQLRTDLVAAEADIEALNVQMELGALEANNGPWSIFGDAIYLKISQGQNAAVGPGIPASADATTKGFVLTSGVGYDIVNTGDSRLNGFGGVRYLNMDVTANISVGPGSRRISGDLRNWDAVVGLRGNQRLSERWGLSYYADIGTGESDLTWQTAVSLEYRINNWDLSVGYRYLDWNISNSPVVSDLTFAGPFLGAKFRF